MPITSLMRKEGRTLIFAEAIDDEDLKKIPNGQIVKVVVTVPRNIRHHRLLFALLKTVLQAQSEPWVYQSTDELLEAIKMGMGHFDMHRHPRTGDIYPRTKSISFAAQDQAAFRDWWDRAVRFILVHIVPNIKEADLEQAVYDLLREPGPNQIER